MFFSYSKELNICILLILGIFTGITTPNQSWLRSNGNEGVPLIIQLSKTEPSPSEALISYPEQLFAASCICRDIPGVFYGVSDHWVLEKCLTHWIKRRFANLIKFGVHQWSGRPGFNPRPRKSKDFKDGTWYLLV